MKVSVFLWKQRLFCPIKLQETDNQKLVEEIKRKKKRWNSKYRMPYTYVNFDLLHLQINLNLPKLQ